MIQAATGGLSSLADGLSTQPGLLYYPGSQNVLGSMMTPSYAFLGNLNKMSENPLPFSSKLRSSTLALPGTRGVRDSFLQIKCMQALPCSSAWERVAYPGQGLHVVSLVSMSLWTFVEWPVLAGMATNSHPISRLGCRECALA